MSKKPIYWNKAKRILSKKDTVMKKLINNYKDGHLITRNDVFFSLCKSIIGQQISVAAASSVFLKFKKKYFPPKRFLEKLYKKFTPYCSVATWYLWRSIDNEPIQY